MQSENPVGRQADHVYDEGKRPQSLRTLCRDRNEGFSSFILHHDHSTDRLGCVMKKWGLQRKVAES